MIRYLTFMLRIRRVEFRIAEIPILGIPIFLLARNTSIFGTLAFWEGVFIFFLLFAFGDMTNCLADRDLDAIYKPHLSESVYGLGVSFVKFQIWATAILAAALSLHVAWSLNRWPIAVLTVIGLLLGTAYSVKPVQLKGRGLLQVACLWAIIFVGPILFISQLIGAEISLGLIAFAAVYGALQMGVILVNTAEDYPEDLALGIRTSVVSLGLARGIWLAALLTIVGSIGLIAILAVFYFNSVTLAGWAIGLLPVAAGCVYVATCVTGLYLQISNVELTTAISVVKKQARKVPIWITIVAWGTLLATGVLFYFRT